MSLSSVLIIEDKNMSDGNIDNTGGNLLSPLEFAPARHNLITEAAFQLLDPEAKARVEELLAAGSTSVEDWGAWADEIKGGGPNDQETVEFKADPANASHETRHYVNLPLGSEGYEQAAKLGYTRNDDVVQSIRTCIRVLRGESDRFSAVNALRLVGHFVGDVHQPLHVGCGFFDRSTDPPTLLSDPKKIADRGLMNAHDKGGNDITLPSSGKMHSFWDGDIGGNIGDIHLESLSAEDENQELIEEERQRLVREIVEGAKAMEGGNLESVNPAALVPAEDRPAEWADGSLAVAREAYKNLKNITKSGTNKYKAEFKTTKAAYIQIFRPVVLNQMSLGARRLADLLNELFPSPGDN
jgi:hypothetical protein